MERDLTATYVIVPIVAIVTFLTAYRIYQQRKWGYCNSTHSLRGKTFLLTGANSGIGFETAKALVKRGARVIFACRDMDSATNAIDNIRKKQKTGGEMLSMYLDLSSLDSIKSFVEVVKVGFDKIDVLINNAGVAVPLSKDIKTKDGFEINFGVNHLGHFLLTNLLLDRLEKAAPSRVVIVSSLFHTMGEIDFEDLNMTKKIEDIKQGKTPKSQPYNNSKLMNIYFAKGLAERTKGKGIDVFVLCPGFTLTNIFRYWLRWYHYIAMLPIAFFLARSAEQGAQTTLHCATEASLQGKSGMYYRNCKASDLTISYDKAIEDKLWTVSENLVNGQVA